MKKILKSARGKDQAEKNDHGHLVGMEEQPCGVMAPLKQ